MTHHCFGVGHAWYLAANGEERFLDDFYRERIRELGLPPAIDAKLPEGVTAQVRTDGQKRYVFLMNFTDQPQQVGCHRLEPFGCSVQTMLENTNA